MTGIMEYFKNLPDPRIDRQKRHKLLNIIFITIAAVIYGADNLEDIEEYGHANYEWLKTFLELPDGIPSHDTFKRVFSLLDPRATAMLYQLGTIGSAGNRG